MVRSAFQMLITGTLCAALLLLLLAFTFMVIGGKPGEPPYCPPNPAECG